MLSLVPLRLVAMLFFLLLPWFFVVHVVVAVVPTCGDVVVVVAIDAYYVFTATDVVAAADDFFSAVAIVLVCLLFLYIFMCVLWTRNKTVKNTQYLLVWACLSIFILDSFIYVTDYNFIIGEECTTPAPFLAGSV